MSVLALVVGAAGTGCGKPMVKCDKLCSKMATCYFEVLQKQEKLSKATIQLVKKSESLQRRFKEHMRKYCKESCQKHNKESKWNRKQVKRIKKCVDKNSCSKFATCVMKYMY